LPRPLSRPVQSILDLIGNTPIVEFLRISPPGGGTIFAKLEFLNPGMSVKDRIGLAMRAGVSLDGLAADHDVSVAVVRWADDDRPALGWARYRTPVANLFLCGSGTHPGTGLDGRSGALAAREIALALKGQRS